MAVLMLKEAGYTDADGDGVVDGTGINADGTVSEVTDILFADNDNNGIADHLDPNDQSACQGDAGWRWCR